jgi:hypothetical protein
MRYKDSAMKFAVTGVFLVIKTLAIKLFLKPAIIAEYLLVSKAYFVQQFSDNCQVIAHTLTALLTEVLYEKYRGQLDEHYQSRSELRVKSGIFSDLT